MEEESKDMNMTRESEMVSKTNWKPLKGFINEIFETNGYPRVKKFGKEFSDGSKRFDSQDCSYYCSTFCSMRRSLSHSETAKTLRARY